VQAYFTACRPNRHIQSDDYTDFEEEVHKYWDPSTMPPIDLPIAPEPRAHNHGAALVGMFRRPDRNYAKDVYIQLVLGKDKVSYKWVDVRGDEVWLPDGRVEDATFQVNEHGLGLTSEEDRYEFAVKSWDKAEHDRITRFNKARAIALAQRIIIDKKIKISDHYGLVQLVLLEDLLMKPFPNHIHRQPGLIQDVIRGCGFAYWRIRTDASVRKLSVPENLPFQWGYGVSINPGEGEPRICPRSLQ
jgi:hypothetical protein